jgi:DNA-binding beta-propeller fold protein YncE
MKRLLWLGLVVAVYMICSGCGETYRPVIIPTPPTFPNPAAAHSVVTISDNGTTVAGSAMVIDVSGDSDVSVANVGLAPVHAAQQSTSEVLVVNHSVTGAASDSITKLNFSSMTISSTNTINLPANSAPNFVAVAPSDTLAYVTLPNFVPDPIDFPGVIVPSVGVVNTGTNNMVATIPVGNNPYALAITPNKSKLYVANQGNGTISAFNTIDRSSRPITGALTSSPIWLVARSDSQRVYVLEQGSGILATIDTTSTAGPDTLTQSAISVPGATTMTYDFNRNRLYIPGGQQLTIVDVSQSLPQSLAGGPIPACSPGQTSSCIPTVLPSSRSSSDPCSLTSADTLTVAAVAALPDSSRVYVGAYYEDTNNNICPQVTVIDASNNTIKTPSIAIPGVPAYDAFCANTRFRIMMAAGGDSTRVYLSSCDGGNVNIIDTSVDAYIENLPAPLSTTRAPIPPSTYNPPQNPVFLFAGP